MITVSDRLRAALATLPASDHDFVHSLLKSADVRGLTSKQLYWAERLIAKAARPIAAPVVVNVGGIVGFLRRAGDKLARPKVRLVTDTGQRVVLSIAGSRSRYCGDVMVTDGGPYGANVYYGRISAQFGAIMGSHALTAEVSALLCQFASDPAGVGALIGKRLGACCFCARQLETAESLAVGYGPVCAESYGLPWG